MATKKPLQSGTTIKQEREARRLEKVEAFKKQQAKERRNKRIVLISSLVAAAVVITLIVVAIVTSNQPKPAPTPGAIGVVQEFPEIAGSGHVETKVDYAADYGMNPPAGGVHSGTWLNCGVYTSPVPNENAVHALEHGAIWITYDANTVSAEDVVKLQSMGLDPQYQGYLVVSPYEGLPAPLVASAWGFQIALDDVDDSALTTFITKYLLASTAPEPGAQCTGGLDAPGRIG